MRGLSTDYLLVYTGLYTIEYTVLYTCDILESLGGWEWVFGDQIKHL
jgi:hypothetical protein